MADESKEIRFQTLYENLLELTEKALKSYVDKYYFQSPSIQVGESGGFSTGIRTFLKYSLHRSLNELRKTPEYAFCFNFLSESEEIKDHRQAIMGENLSKMDLQNEIEAIYLLSFIEKIAEETNLDFAQPVFDKFYQKLEAFLFEKEIKIVEITPLPYFVCGRDELCLGRGLKIHRISKIEKNQMLHEEIAIMGTAWDVAGILATSDFVVEYVWGPVSGRPPATVEQVTLALSFFKPKSRVDSYGNLHYESTWFRRFTGGSGPPIGVTYSEPYELNERSVEAFLRFWKDDYLPVMREDTHFLNIAINRYNSSRRGSNWVYGLIDLMTSLEALYLSKGGELSYRLSHRCATLLGLEKTAPEKERIRSMIKKAYDIRNELVHGGNLDWKKFGENRPDFRPYDFVIDVFEYVRQSICKFLEINRTHNLSKKNRERLLDAVDKAIYDEENLKKFLAISK